MSTSKTPAQRYFEKLVPFGNGHTGWLAGLTQEGHAKFSYIDTDGRHRTTTGQKFRWQLERDPLLEGARLFNTCGLPACQTLDHWEPHQPRVGTLWEQYESMFTRLGPDDCWPWQETSRDKDGYGLFSFKDPEAGKWVVVRATRWAWERLYQPLKPGMFVCHRCDFPPCQNPAHWFEGTPRSNNKDMMLKGRARSGFGTGESHHNAKLTWAIVDEMRLMHAADPELTHQQIADRFHADRRHVSDILAGKIWRKR
jgi:hypothetical protein